MNATSYITLAEAKAHLNVDSSFTGDDSLITDQLNAAMHIVAEDACRRCDELIGNDGKMIPVARQAILLKLGSLYAYREDIKDGAVTEVPLAYRHLVHLIRNYR